MKLLILIYLQFLYTIGAFKGRCWIDQQILWCYKTLESMGHKVEHYYRIPEKQNK